MIHDALATIGVFLAIAALVAIAYLAGALRDALVERDGEPELRLKAEADNSRLRGGIREAMGHAEAILRIARGVRDGEADE